jgi:hypothetical protein
MKLFYVGLLCVAGAARGAPPVEETMPVVQVEGLADPDEQSYRRMMKGMDAFEKYHDLAPMARLRYRLYPRLPGVKADGVKLTIVGQSVKLPLELAGDLTFTLPRDVQATMENAQVTANRRSRSFAWGPDVRTPGLPTNVRRLGDLRLECEIDRAATLLVGYKPPLYHVIDATVDVCTQFPGSWIYYADRALFNVTLVHGTRRQTMFSPYMYANQLPKVFHYFYDFYPMLVDRTYQLKIADTSWPDDTLVELEYMDDDEAVATSSIELQGAP